MQKQKMLECTKFGDCKIKTIRHHLPQQYKFSRKEINIDDDYDGYKLFTAIPGAYRIILGSTHPDRHDVIDFLVERHNYLQGQTWKA